MPGEKVPYKRGTGCLVMVTLFTLGCISTGTLAYLRKPGLLTLTCAGVFLSLMVICFFVMPRGRRK